ncbi:hypothetical protein IW261DRAFT_1421641 [Armillaria novae-zelandiae]|uniref:Uncharacterized protein n=1 Tax=Armillaria novae-zelandiae TaxID=153914 RepID=A0AA39P368_9AGAR|nr:hypothetical protein IW261DRAFT_1421641 [Armillaria novae-zelandiae]
MTGTLYTELIPDSQGLAFDRRFRYAPSEDSKAVVGPSSNNRLSFITHKLPQTARISTMISTLEINRALRRAFKDRYQRRETKVNIPSKGEMVQNQIHIVTGKTSVTKNRPHQERKESAGRAPSPEATYRHSWNQEVLAMLRYSTSTFRMGL